MGKFKAWIKEMSFKDKIKNSLLTIFGLFSGIVLTVLGIKRRRSNKDRDSNTRSYDEYHKDAKSTNNRIRDNIQSSRSGVNDSIDTVEGIRSEINASRERQQSIRQSIDDVINDPANRKES